MYLKVVKKGLAMKQRRINSTLAIAALALTALLILTALPLAGTAAPTVTSLSTNPKRINESAAAHSFIRSPFVDSSPGTTTRVSAAPRLEREPLESLTGLNSTEATERGAPLSAFSASSVASVVQPPGTTTRVSTALRSAPVMFIENVGQFDERARLGEASNNPTWNKHMHTASVPPSATRPDIAATAWCQHFDSLHRTDLDPNIYSTSTNNQGWIDPQLDGLHMGIGSNRDSAGVRFLPNISSDFDASVDYRLVALPGDAKFALATSLTTCTPYGPYCRLERRNHDYWTNVGSGSTVVPETGNSGSMRIISEGNVFSVYRKLDNGDWQRIASQTTSTSDAQVHIGLWSTLYTSGAEIILEIFSVKWECVVTSLGASPDSVPADNVSSSVVILSNAPVNHRVRLVSSRGSLDAFTPASGTTDASGRFVATVRSSTPGTSVITAQDLTTGQTFATSASVTFTPVGPEPPPPPSEDFDFVVESTYALNGRFLEGLSLPNRILIQVPWPDAPGEVIIRLNGHELVSMTQPNAGIRYEYILDMGIELHVGPNILEVIAKPQTSSGVTKSFTPWSWPTPVWLWALQELGLAGPLVLAGDFDASLAPRFEATITIPQQPFEALVDFGITGKKAGIYPTYFEGEFKVPLLPDQQGSVRGAVTGGFALWDGEAKWKGGLFGEGHWQTTSPYIVVERAGAFLELNYEQEVYRASILGFLAELSPGLGTAAKKLAEGLGIERFLQRYGYVYVDGKLKLVGEGSIVFEPDVHLEWLRGGGSVGIEGGIRIYVKPVEFHAYLGADGEAEFATDPSLHISKLALIGKAGVEFIVFWFKTTAEGKVELVYPQPGALAYTMSTLDVAHSPWHLLGHGYRKSYAVFHKPLPGKMTPFSSQALGVITEGLATITAGEVLVSNVYTYTEPSLALNPANDNALLLWVHDDVNKPLGQNFDLAYSYWDGNTWSTPGRVTDDTYLDGDSQVAWDSSGHGLAVWERLNDPALPITATLDTTTTKKIEIAWAQYDPTSDIWSDLAWLTTNNALDYKPSLARNSAGGVLTVWRQNPAGLLSGDTANPDRVMFAAWDGAGWNAPAVAVEDIPGLVDLAAGYGGGQATLAYTRFLTPTGSITPTLQLFTSNWDGSTWSSPQQLTDDDLGHTNPQVVYNSVNQPLLVWQAGNTLRLRNLTTGTEVDLALDPDLVVNEFRLLRDAVDNLAVVFTGHQAGQRDLFVTFYNAAHNTWGRPYRLTNDVHSEGYPAPALDSTGRLVMAYALTQVSSEEHTTTDTDTGEVITYTLPVEGQTDLYTLSHQFVQDLAMGALSVSDTHPQAGASVTISATVTNTGALVLEGVQVAFYDGDPDTGGTLINTAMLSGTLAAGYTATLTTTYTIPTTGGQRQLVAVADPQDQIAEADETNNRASLLAFGPDLELVGAGVDYWSGSSLGLSALIYNIGTTDSLTTTIVYHWDAITGTLAVTDTVPTLAAGGAITLTTPWDYGALAEGSYPLVAVVNEGEQDFAETFTDNNEALLTLQVLPDLAVSPLYLWTEPLSDGQVVITGTVYNFGNVAAPPVETAFYVDDPFTDTARISVTMLPELDAAGYAIVTTTWTAPTFGQHAFYVAVNFGRTVTETTWINNLASTYGASACTALEVDFDCSCIVDVADIMEVASRWRCRLGEDCYEELYDLDHDYDIDIVDIMLVVVHWGEVCE